MKKEEYLHLVTDQIRCKKARPDVKTELEAHIMDQMEDYRNEGMEEQEAMERAILEMGDPVEVGVELDRIHRPKMSWEILLLVGILGESVFFYSLPCGEVAMQRRSHSGSLCFTSQVF